MGIPFMPKAFKMSLHIPLWISLSIEFLLSIGATTISVVRKYAPFLSFYRKQGSVNTHLLIYVKIADCFATSGFKQFTTSIIVHEYVD